MSEYNFESVFAFHFNSFLKMKETMGFGLVKFKTILKEFDRFFIAHNVADLCITQSLLSEWSKTQVNVSCRTLYDKYSIISQFCKYMCHTGYVCYVPRLPRRQFVGYIPYIFTQEQMLQFFTTCDALVMTSRNMDCILFALPSLYRLLYSTGVRISEAISLKNEDVDFKRQCIIIKKTKNQQQRLIPLNSSMLQTMLQYKEARDSMPLKNKIEPNSFFFISPSGRPLTQGTVYNWFKVILRKCGIPHVGKNHGPRVHDIRHTCAVHSLIKQVKSGADIYCVLPVISVFLGHKTIKGTEKYVRLTQKMYPEIIEMEQSVTSFVFPSQPVIEIDYEE
jgi:integrase